MPPKIVNEQGQNFIVENGQKTNLQFASPELVSRAGSAISVSDLQPIEPLKVPSTPTLTKSAGLIASLPVQDINKQAEQTAQELTGNQDLTSKKGAVETLLNQITTRLAGNKGQAGLTAETYASSGVDTAQKELNDITNQINQRTLAYRRQIEEIQKNPQGKTTAGLQNEINQVNQESARELADLSIIQQAKQGNYSTAKDIADRKVAAQLEQQKNELDVLKFIYGENKDELTKKEDQQFQIKINERTRLLNQQEADKKLINETALNALKNGAPIDLVQSALKSDSSKDVIIMLGGYVDRYDMLYKRAQTSEKLGGSGSKLEQLDPTSPAYFQNLLVASKGGKKPNQVETIRPIQKSVAVINQLADLQTAVKKSTTGPVVGTLKKMNPYDFDARAVQAILQSTVPNLARGVYGEVGVLTDQDIRNYIQTLPNITSTKKQNDFVTAMTLKTVQRNLESQLETLASAGYDVSGFTNQYNKIKSKVEQIELDLGIPQETPEQGSDTGLSNTNDPLGLFR